MPITKASPHKGLKAAGAPVMLKSDHETHLYTMYLQKRCLQKRPVYDFDDERTQICQKFVVLPAARVPRQACRPWVCRVCHGTPNFWQIN